MQSGELRRLYLNKITDVVEQYALVQGFQPLYADSLTRFKIYYNQLRNIVITTPIAADDKTSNDNQIPTYRTVLQIEDTFDDFKYLNPRFIRPVCGKGLVENHIVTLCETAVLSRLYDSKDSPLGSVFHIEGAPDHIEMIGTGSQSTADLTTCGYHTIANIKTINEAANIASIDLDKLRENAREYLNRIPLDNLSTRIKNVWNETFHIDKRHPFENYFLGLPEDHHADAAIGYMLGGFALIPLKNTIKALTEFPLKVIKTAIDYAMDKVKLGDRSTPARRRLNTLLLIALGGLSGVVTLLWGVTRTVTSPITSFKEARDIHPLLGVASVLCSAVLYVGLGMLVGPVALLCVGKIAGPKAVAAISSGLAKVNGAPVMSQVIDAITTGAKAIFSSLSLSAVTTTISLLTGAATFVRATVKFLTKKAVEACVAKRESSRFSTAGIISKTGGPTQYQRGADLYSGFVPVGSSTSSHRSSTSNQLIDGSVAGAEPAPSLAQRPHQ